MAPKAPVNFQIIQGQQVGHVNILVGGHVQVTVLEREGNHRIAAAQQERREIVGADSLVFLTYHLDELVNQPGHGTLVFGTEVITASRNTRIAKIPTEIIGHMDGYFNAIAVQDGGLGATLQVLFQVIGHLDIRNPSLHVGVDVVLVHGFRAPHQVVASYGKESYYQQVRKKSQKRHGP